MATKTNVSAVGDGTVVVEAPSVEAALDAVTKEFGTQATIVDAERVNRGGVGGFFSKETYRVVVQPAGSVPDSRPTQRDPIDVVRGTANLVQRAAGQTRTVDLRDSVVLDSPLSAVDRALASVELGESETATTEQSPAVFAADTLTNDAVVASPTFGEALRAELRMRDQQPATPAEVLQDPNPEPVEIEAALPPTPEAVPVVDLRLPTARVTQQDQQVESPVAEPEVVAPSVQLVRQPLGHATDVCPPGSGAVLWSADALSRVGLPYTLIRPLADLDPSDDLAWVYRLAESVAALCGPIETNDVVLMGRNVSVLANALDLGVVVSPEAPTYTGSVAVETDLTEFNATYLENVAAGRPVHLFCGAGGDFMPRNVEAVSWCGDHLSSALHVAIETGARLGYMVRGDDTIRVTPFELALAVRSRLARS